MKYYISSKKIPMEGYQTLNLRSNIDFSNDELFFDDLAYAIKYSYYFNDNKIVVKLQKRDLKRLDTLQFLIFNSPNCEFKYPIDKRGEILFKRIVNFYKIMNCLKFKKKLIYDIYEVDFCGEKIYVLENVIINKHNMCNNDIHYWKQVSDIPINYKIKKVNKKILNIIDKSEKVYLEDFDYIMDENKVLSVIDFKPSVYIYQIVINEDYSYMDLMFQNYMHLRYEPQIICNREYKIMDNEKDCKYYSKIANEYKENFKRIKWKTTKDISISFMYNDIEMRTLGTRKVYNNLIRNNYRIKVHSKLVTIYKILIPEMLLPQEKEYYNLQAEVKSKPIYLFQDRPLHADDNAESLYRYYVNNNSNVECYFVLSKKSKDFSRLETEGFNLVDFGSEEHKRLYIQCDKLISSHAARRIYDPYYPYNGHRHFEKFMFVFLQHGIIMGEHNGFLDYINNDIDLFISSTKEEKEIIENFSGLNCVVNTGLARYDNYKNSEVGDYILYAPSWNTLYEENLQNSEYVKEIENVLNDEKINEILTKNNKKLKLLLPPEFIDLNIKFKNKYNIEIIDSDNVQYRKELSNCCGLITDYSSLFFDVLYQGKVVIHHQPYELHHENKKLTTFYSSIEKTYEISELVSTIERIANNNWKLLEDQKKNLDNIYSFRDFKNCERIFNKIEKM